MLEFLSENLSSCVALAVLLVAMCPMVESKIAIPFALSTAVWGESALSPFLAFLVSFVGCIIPSIFVIFFTRKIKNKTSGFIHDKFTERVNEKYKKKFDKLGQKQSIFQKCLLIATFVAVPLPMTGVYTGSIISGFTTLKIWQALLSVVLGALVSCGVVLLLCVAFENSELYVLLASVILCVAVALFNMFCKVASVFKRKCHRV